MSLSDWIFVVWILLLGSCVGSFLNVVVYRLPAGKSLVHPGSRCPHCDKPIRIYHNLPILGWLFLSGRCHDCRSPISIRYPLVELITAIWFAVIVGAVFYIDAQLAVRSVGLLWMLAGSLIVFGCVVLCSLLVLQDRAAIPRILIGILVISGVMVGACFLSLLIP